MNTIDKLTISEAREIASIFGSATRKSHSFQIGGKYLFRTVTCYYTGQIEAITDTDIVLSSAAWIADTGRFSDALTSCDFNEVEPYPERVILNRSAIVDATPINILPRSQK